MPERKSPNYIKAEIKAAVENAAMVGKSGQQFLEYCNRMSDYINTLVDPYFNSVVEPKPDFDLPGKCIYQGKEWRILNIDMQGGYFDLHDPELGMLEHIDIEECKPINRNSYDRPV